MSRYLVELRTLADWQSRLRDPELHWKRGASAMELAVAWIAARSAHRGIPPDVAALLDQQPQFSGAVLQLAVPELKTRLDGKGSPSQTDLWALLRCSIGSVSLSVEGKGSEPFGEPVDRWLSARSRSEQVPSARRRRLGSLVQRLGLDGTAVGSLRYQLLHRSAAALIEAENWRADAAVMLVQRFARRAATPAPTWSDFRAFAACLSADVHPGALSRATVPGSIPLYIGWIDCPLARDEEIAAATLGDRARSGQLMPA